MTDLTDRLLRHADLHAYQPWADDEQMQFARDLRDAAALIVSKAPTDTQKPVAEIMIAKDGEVSLNWLPDSGDRLTLGAKLYLAAPQVQPAQPLPLVQATAPRNIWLQISDESDDSGEPFPTDNDGITWAKDAALMCAVPYVRADLAQAQPVPAQRLSDVQIADCAATIRPYPKELAEVPAEQVIAFVRAIEDALIGAPKDAA